MNDLEQQKEIINLKYQLKIELEKLKHKNIMEEIKEAGKYKIKQIIRK